MNAFQMARELGLAVEIRVDYRIGGDLVRAEEVEKGVRSLMEGSDEIRRKVKEMSDKCKEALMENGSSYNNLVSLIQELTS
ncbi:Anthocyanidin 3-O-glucosyltransferase 1 [Spatholobus suberectus]|nr:Anthocyanidin 3-O-glucosyltransferase 1 [Spatholobus suberectus]